MSSMNKLAKELKGLLDEADARKPKAYSTTAEVTRVEDDTIWVHIPGGIEETPVRKTINASRGDVVKVNIENGGAWVIGNVSAPPTDDAKANKAFTVGENAFTKATEAEKEALRAGEASDRAESEAIRAGKAADRAETEANRAYKKATEAEKEALRAGEAADRAETEANRAYKEAEKATGYANDSLSQLSIVEDVVGTLNWITTHATYKASADTEVHAGKWYFTKSGDTYNVVVNPTGNPSTKGWYEIDSIDEAVSNYVASHLALTNEGLYLTKDGNGYKILLANDGLKVYDPGGHLVSTFGESIIFDSARPQTIGNNNVYIKYYDKNNDGTPDSLAIKADEFLLSSGKTIQEEIEAVENWFYSVPPTTSNEPAKDWTTTSLKEQHLRDIYFDTTSGKSYRWAKEGTTYKWVEIEDVELAALAKDLHDNYPPRSEFTVAPDKIQSTVSAAQTAATNAANTATDNKLTSYSTTTQMNSAIEQKAGEITTSVSSIYETKSDATSKLNTAKGYADSEITSAKAKIKVTTDGISSEVAKKVGNSEVISKINQSAETVKIQASKVEIDGTATFNAIKASADAAYDAKGAASAVQTNVKAEIDAKKSVHTLMSAFTGSTYANILAWTAEGRKNTSWGIDTTATPIDKIKVGDTVRVAYKVTDMGTADNRPYVYVIGTFERSSGNTVYLTMHGLDTTIIDGGNILTNSIGANKIKVNELAIGQSQVNGLPTALANTKKLYKHNVDLTSSSYNQDTWYPVLIGPCPSTDASIYFRCSIINDGGTPSWSSHSSKHWACEVEALYSVSDWGWKSDNNSYIDAYTFGQTSTKPIVLSNALFNTRYLVVYLRGGGYYPIQTSIADTPQIKTSSYTINSQTVAPTTTQPANTTNFVISRREGDTKTNEAAKTATSYITNIGSDGIRVHPASTGNNSVLINSDGMTVYKGGTADTDSVAFYGDTARIGKKDSRHVEVKTGGMQVYNGASDSDLVTHIGYESVQGESGPVMGAFFTFGVRPSNQTKGEFSVAEGCETTASGFCSHAEGYNTTASGFCSHAEGRGTTASSYGSHAEGYKSNASGYCSHAEGDNTTASGYGSHAEGYNTTASGYCSHAGGGYTHASRKYQTVIGTYNKILSGDGTTDSPYVSTDAAFIIGGGTARTTSDSKDIFSVGWTGNVKLAIDSSATGSGTVDGKIMDSLRSLGWDASTEGVIV